MEYENIGAGCARLAWTLPPVPIGPAVALTFPPMVTFPPRENARTASSLLRTITKSVISAPICRPQPTPPVAMHDGADHEPSGKREMTRPEPAFPEKTKPALRTWKTARPRVRRMSNWGETGIRIRRSRSRDTSCTMQNDLGNRVESRFRVVRISFGKGFSAFQGAFEWETNRERTRGSWQPSQLLQAS